MVFSLNNRFVLEPYKKDGLRSEVKNGIATPGQRDGLKGLKTLVSVTLSDGRTIPVGSTAYIREEILYNPGFANKVLKCDLFPEGFIVADLQNIEMIKTPEDS